MSYKETIPSRRFFLAKVEGRRSAVGGEEDCTFIDFKLFIQWPINFPAILFCDSVLQGNREKMSP